MSVIPSHRTAAAGADDHRAWPSRPYPGDLSRRLAARRAELRLSIPQVARQAQVSARYLEYLEKFPSQPGVPVLRRLAAALRTTPTALLGAGGEEPRDHAGESGRPGAPGRLEGLFPAECRRLLAPGGVGRIAFATAAGLMVLPVNYVIASSTVVLRTGAGSLIAAHGDDQVAFEADHLDEALGQGWSVLVRGRAHRVLQPGELRNLKQECEPRPWPAGEHDLYIRIIPEHISGRRIKAQ